MVSTSGAAKSGVHFCGDSLRESFPLMGGVQTRVVFRLQAVAKGRRKAISEGRYSSVYVISAHLSGELLNTDQ